MTIDYYRQLLRAASILSIEKRCLSVHYTCSSFIGVFCSLIISVALVVNDFKSMKNASKKKSQTSSSQQDGSDF